VIRVFTESCDPLVNFEEEKERKEFGPKTREYQILIHLTDDDWEEYIDSSAGSNVNYDSSEDVFTVN